MQARQLSWLVAAGLVAGSAALPLDVARGEEARQERTVQPRFRDMDRDGDGVITRDEFRGSLRSFRQYDLNHDGVLSGEEIWVPTDRAGARDRVGTSGSSDPSATFNRADSNRDGMLSRSEWYGDAATFERIDRNNDGRISRTEFLGEAGADEVDDERPSFAELDSNRNGVVTVNEWRGNRETFLTLDTDGDRVLTRSEFNAQREPDETPAYKAGYNRGLAEGRQAGREDRARNTWDLEGQRELEQADSGYQESIGPRSEYQAGYRAGFRLGYRQGFGPKDSR
jgi:Ca2+-binding EF-hand superfamily protein